MKLHVTDDVTIDFIQFKNIKIAIDRNICVFISGINKDNNIKVHKYVRKKLLQKFKAYAWDFIGCDKNMLHIKFLVKYSPILSKFIDLSEFNEIEFCSPDLSINKRYCLKINDKNIFSTRDLDYERIGIQMDPYLKELLMQEDSNNDN